MRVCEFGLAQSHTLMCSYTTGDLEGLKVSHDFTEMDEGEFRILTLKDSRILDDEGLHHLCRIGGLLTWSHSEDELQNVEMAEEDRRKKNQELKIKRRDYTGYDDDEFDPGKVGIRRSVLSKYDTVIDGEKSTVGFLQPTAGLLLIVPQELRLGSSMKVSNQKIVDQDEVATVSVNTSLLSVDYASK